MKPILPPTITNQIAATQDRVTSLERATKPFFNQTLPDACVSAAGRASSLLDGDSNVEFVSSGLRPHTPFIIQEIFVDFENPTNQWSFTISIDDSQVQTVTIPAELTHIKHRVQPTLLLSSTQTLTIQSNTLKAEAGFVTIQLIGRSSTTINQTLALNFLEA